MEAVQRDYSPRGVRFYYVYKALAHPEKDGYVQPFTLKDRLLHIAEARKRIDTDITWICDNMDNAMVEVMGMAPNSEFIVDPAGRIVRKRAWSDPAALRRDLAELIGPVENPTVLTAQDVKIAPVEKPAPKGVVPRLKVPRNLRPVVVKPAISIDDTPFYVKLRADADPKLLLNGKGEGKLYLGFFLDPIYHVHWNNQVEPIRVEISAADGVTVSPTQLKGPKVDAPSDIDPREFLVDLRANTTNAPIQLTVHYFGCNDAEGWCMPITQRYTVHLQRDLHSGWPANRMHHKAPLDAPPPPPRRRNAPTGQPNMIAGEIVAIDTDNRTLQVRTRDGELQTLNAPKTMMLQRNGRRSTLPELQPRDRVRLQFTPAREGNPTIRRMQARSAPR